jgi:hypothetical protein
MARSKLKRRQAEFQQVLDEIRTVASDLQTALGRRALWGQHQWRGYMVAEGLLTRAFTEWEDFSARVIVLTLSKNTSKLASTTGLSVPTRVTEDLAEALLTARHYLDFRGAGDLKGQARKWLVQSPFDGLTNAHVSTLDDMKNIRNYVAHRSRQSLAGYHQVLSAACVPNHTPPGEFLSQQSPTRLDTYLAELLGMGTIIVP